MGPAIVHPTNRGSPNVKMRRRGIQFLRDRGMTQIVQLLSYRGLPYFNPLSFHFGTRSPGPQKASASSFRLYAIGTALHHDEAGALQVPDQPLRHDLGHELSRIVLPASTIESQREREGGGDVAGIGGCELIVGHARPYRESGSRF